MAKSLLFHTVAPCLGVLCNVKVHSAMSKCVAQYPGVLARCESTCTVICWIRAAQSELSFPCSVGIVYDERMLQHECEWDDHPECPDRLKMAYERCQHYGLIDRCVPIMVSKMLKFPKTWYLLGLNSWGFWVLECNGLNWCLKLSLKVSYKTNIQGCLEISVQATDRCSLVAR